MGNMITKEDRELIEELFSKFNKGERIKSQVLTDLYNRVTGKNLTNTTCGSCLRQRLFEVVDILNKAKKNYAKKLSDEDRKFLEWAKQLEKDHYPSFDKVVELYNRVFNQNRPITNCLACIKQMLEELYKL